LRRDRAAQERQFRANRVGKAKQHASPNRADGHPVAKDHGCQTDEALARRHTFVKPANRAERKECAGDPSHQTAQDHAHVAGTNDIDPQGIRRFGVFTHRAKAQSPASLKERQLQHDQDYEHQVNKDVLVEQDRTKQWNISQSG